ncbi:EAL domain-containing protein [Methylomagnum ishizawai]|uniref:EAL domain-containing protein n=1 Tax=Methylomagnum ishizawai TaxID=1760988 RepID=UPI001C32D998|nr:EAL domain-containing protein [Methylomagnum ishizawai]BBL73931.1 hypothetical protein MishRS11D_10290 [Methylomagnum ishizawai]
MRRLLRQILCVHATLAMGMAAWAGEPVVLQLKWQHAYQFAGYYVAQAKGYYRDLGLDVDIREGRPGLDFVAEVVSGRAQYGTGSSGLLLDRAQGAPVVVLGVVFQHSPDVLMVPAQAGVGSPQQLVGKRVMTNYSTPAVAAMLRSETGALSKFKLSDQANDMAGLIEGRLDALAGYETDQPFLFQQRGFPVALLRPLHYGVDFYGDNLFTSEAELRGHPRRARAFRAASLRGWEYAMTHPDEVIPLVRRYGSTRSVEHLRYEYEAMRSLILSDVVELGYVNPGRWRHIADTYVGLGLLRHDYSLDGFLYDPEPDRVWDGVRGYLWAAATAVGLALGVILALFRFNRRLRREVRERLSVEQRLRRSEQRLTEAQRIAHIGSWELDLATGRAAWSDEMYRLLGYEVGGVESCLENLLRRVPEQDRRKLAGALAAVRERSDGAYRVEYRVVPPGGEARVVDERGRVVFDGLGRPVLMIGTTLDITERKRYELALKEQRTYLRTIFEHDPQCIKLLDRDGVLLDMNPAGLAMVEADSLDQVRGRAVYGMVSDKDRGGFIEMVAAVFQGEPRRLIFEGTGLKGTRRHLETHSVPLWDSERRGVRALLGVTQDVTERLRAEEKLRLSAAVVEATQEGVMITDPELRIVAVNRAFTAITGYQESEVVGRQPALLASGRHGQDFYQAMWASIDAVGSWQGELWNRRKNGESYPEWLTINVVKDAEDRVIHYVGVFSDISHLKQSQSQLEYLAHHDPLTGLPNRLLFTARLEHGLERAERNGLRGAVLFLDLDRFKHVNDSLGHNIGDELLRQVSARLGQAVRREDTVARLGGDEFTVLIENLKDSDDAARLAAKLIHGLTDAFVVDGRRLFIGASVGISVYPKDGRTVDQLLSNADAAMYRAKEEGRNTYRFYTEEMTAQALEHLELQSRLRHAIEAGQLVLHYQPQVELAGGRMVGLEALVRWEHPEQGLVEPSRFVPVAEDTGLILPLGEWVLRQACFQARAWLDAGLEFGRVSVNVAGKQVQRGDLLAVVRLALADSGLPPERLELEITESFVMKEAERAIDLLRAIRALGVALAIDDFGTGYSSLAYLKLLPFDKLKIDKGFVRDLPWDENDAAIARAVIALGHSLQFTVIAEGVENEAQRECLLRDGCDQAQGYLYGPPMAWERVEALLRREGESRRVVGL